MRLNELYDKQSGQGTYICVNLSGKSADKLDKWCKESLIPNQNPKEEFHCTLVYSKDNLPPHVELPRYSEPFKIEPSSFQYALFGDRENILVLKFKQEELQARWRSLMDEHKFQYDFPTYIPHLTLSYDVPEGFNINRLELPNFPIYLVGEHREALDDGDDNLNEDGRIVKGVNTTF